MTDADVKLKKEKLFSLHTVTVLYKKRLLGSWTWARVNMNLSICNCLKKPDCA